ncbi:hypothetical protein GRI58_13490 [Porphyrobacter algicida]|uniref:Uncharacterized protein n=1 Tax=Qipengyuania algicida TaxID=1836209 RepID=A0A845AGU1_9SPHN|nr:hypothetical protein [Qipengyuania algicida]MXP29822.1 hypothetical protein [Qipengyuania algicida]
MDSESKTTLPSELDAGHAARIVENINDLERDYRLAEGPMTEWLLSQIAATMRNALGDGYEVFRTDYTILIMTSDWKPTKRLGRGDAWLELMELTEDESGYTWLAAATGSGDTKMVLELMWRPGLIHTGEAIAADKAHAAKLEKIGFQRHEDTGKRWYIPFVIDRMQLAKGFSENDIDAALLPVKKAVEAIAAGKADLDQLIAKVQDTGKGA